MYKRQELDLDEPRKVAEAVREMGLQHVVITSVARDDLQLEGADLFAQTIEAIRELSPLTAIEVLIPDFNGHEELLDIVMHARPKILNHNIETVERLSDRVRARAKYRRSLELLQRARLKADAISQEIRARLPKASSIQTKSGIMVGLGESVDEIKQTLRDLREVGVDIITIGQYLQPSRQHLQIEKYYTPDEFAELKKYGLSLGFAHVESGPLVRSSYHAHEQSLQSEKV